METQLISLIDRMMPSWGEIVVPIFVASQKSLGAAEGIGSGFLITFKGAHFLVTALHVLHHAKESDLIANICEKSVFLAGMTFHKSEEFDIAFCELSEQWLQRNEIPKIKSAQAQRELEGWQKTGIYIAVGYPSTKNILNPKRGNLNRNCLSISLSKAKNLTVSTAIKEPLIFSYDHKQVFDSIGNKLGPQPKLQGMSGGPCFELIIKNGEDLTFSLDAVGILVEWHKIARAIVASPITAILPRPNGDT